MLKFRRIKKQQADQQQAQAASAAQAEAQGQAQIQVENAKAQAEQVKTESKIQYRKADIEFEIKKLEVEARSKRELMQFEYDLNVQLKELELQAQKELVDAQNTSKEKISLSKVTGPVDAGKPKKSFESKGNDVLGGFDLSRFAGLTCSITWSSKGFKFFRGPSTSLSAHPDLPLAYKTGKSSCSSLASKLTNKSNVSSNTSLAL